MKHMHGKKAQELFQQHNTDDPWELANRLGITVIKYPMKNLNGVYFSLEEYKFATINLRLSFDEQTYTLAHEIGHALLHPDVNYFSINKRNEVLEPLRAKQNYLLNLWLKNIVKRKRNDY